MAKEKLTKKQKKEETKLKPTELDKDLKKLLLTKPKKDN